MDVLSALLLALGIFCLSISLISLIGYAVFGSKVRHLLTVLSVSFTAGALAILSRAFLTNFPN